MIEPRELDEIVAVYQKYGWVLRRVLLSPELKNRLKTIGSDVLDSAVVTDSDIDAAWFSRPPKKGGIAWEIRHLSSVPYALLENVDEDDEGFEVVLAAVEERLRGAISATKSLDKLAANRSNLSN